MQGHIILRYRHLRGYLYSLFPKIMNILDRINEWQLKIKPRLKLSIELLKPMEEQSILFRHDDGEAKVLPVVFANSLRVVLLTLAIVA